MPFFDFHTHNYDADRNFSILNSTTYIAGRRISIGLHPWDISEGWQQRLLKMTETAHNKNVIAIGECGIDKTNSPADIETQTGIFLKQALLAEEVSKPLIIHCVKGIDEIIAIYKKITPVQAWIFHGFRGNRQQAEQLIRHGFYLSLGAHFNKEAAEFIPCDRLFIESDESIEEISEIYRKISIVKNIPVEELKTSICENLSRIIQF